MKDLEQQAAELTSQFEKVMIHAVLLQESVSDDAMHDLSKQESNVIYILGTRNALIMRELAENMRLHVSTMTGIVDKLTDKGFVTRTRTEEDRRIVRVALTDAGQTAYKQESEKRKQLSLAILTALNQNERDDFIKLFGKVVANLESIKVEPE